MALLCLYIISSAILMVGILRQVIILPTSELQALLQRCIVIFTGLLEKDVNVACTILTCYYRAWNNIGNLPTIFLICMGNIYSSHSNWQCPSNLTSHDSDTSTCWKVAISDREVVLASVLLLVDLTKCAMNASRTRKTTLFQTRINDSWNMRHERIGFHSMICNARPKSVDDPDEPTTNKWAQWQTDLWNIFKKTH